MQRRTQAAAALAAGSLVLTGVGVSVAAAASSSKTHTLTFLSKQTSGKSKNFIDADRDVVHGKVIGNDVVTGKYNPRTKTVVGDVSVGLKGGQIYAHFKLDPNDGSLEGSGDGRHRQVKGITGTITGTRGPGIWTFERSQSLPLGAISASPSRRCGGGGGRYANHPPP